MDYYTVTGRSVNFQAGSVLALDKDQIARRAHLVEPVEGVVKGVTKKDLDGRLSYTAIKMVQFKHGECIGVIECVGMNKQFLQMVAPKGSSLAVEAEVKAADRLATGHAINEQRAEDAQRQADARAGRASIPTPMNPPSPKEGDDNGDGEKPPAPAPAPQEPPSDGVKPAGLADDTDTAKADNEGKGALQTEAMFPLTDTDKGGG